jgi:hypothetical protein
MIQTSLLSFVKTETSLAEAELRGGPDEGYAFTGGRTLWSFDVRCGCL